MVSSVPWRGGRVVVVDDNMAMANMLADFLRLIGHDSAVLPVTSVVGLAQDILGVAPDIAFVDLSLGGMDGRDVAVELRARGCTAQLIAITGHDRPDDPERSRQAGFDQHWTKPLDVERIERFMATPPQRRSRRSCSGAV